jgi:hypothetical protein
MTLAEVSSLLAREAPVAAGGIPVTQDFGAFPIRLRTIRSGWGGQTPRVTSLAGPHS